MSVVIVTMGADEMLRGCIDSLRCRVKVGIEVIVVNNAAEPLGLEGFAGLEVIENGRNLGFARAVNRGIARAGAPYICLLNSDTFFTRDTLGPMVDFMEARPAAGICGVQLIFEDGSRQNSIDICPRLATEFVNKSLLKLVFRRHYPSKRSGFRAPVQVPSVIGACMLIRRELIDAIGDLDEGFFFYLEETDFCQRARNAGYEVWHLPQLELIHFQGGTARKLDLRRKIEYRRSLITYFCKHHGARRTGLLVTLTLLKSLVEIALNLPLAMHAGMRDRLRKSFAILLWHLGGCPAGWGLERPAPAGRRRRLGGYTWFVHDGRDVPAAVQDPQAFMDGFSDEVLNISRTAYVKSGRFEGRTIYLKRYNFKGLTDSIKNLFRKSRAQKAFEAALMLEHMGIATPEVVFACEKRFCGLLLVSFIATEGIPASDLVKYGAEHGFSDDDIRLVARFMRRMHAMGILHVDLKGENMLIDHQKNIFLIDLDRLRRVRHLGLKARARNLSYLNASFATSEPEHRRSRFLDEYLDGNPALARQRAFLAKTIRDLTRRRLDSRY